MKKITRHSKLFRAIIQSIQNKKGYHIVSLDLYAVNEAVCDYFIICSASNSNQIKAIMDEIEDGVYRQCGMPPYRTEGKAQSPWGIVDYVDVVVHIMLEENRDFYQLEHLWHDARACSY